jgi:hypothetical protein
MKCCLCGEEIPVVNGWAEGHNPDPLAIGEDDRCCSDCNATKVIPARLGVVRGKDELDSFL